MRFHQPPYAGTTCWSPPCPVPGGDLVAAILRAIDGEMAARQAYLKIIPMAQTREAESNIRVILDDETKHLQAFTCLLARFALVSPPPLRAPEPTFTDYGEGVREAYYDELDAAEFYRSIMLSSMDPQVQRVFFEAMTDEMEHAIRLNRLLYLAGQGHG